MTIVEKILAAHAGKQSVTSGEFINVKVDLVMASDLTAHISINQLQALGIRKLFDPSKIVFVMDHFTPNKDVAAAMEIKKMREFARELGVNFIEAGDIGIEHVYLPEKGLVLPGEVVVGEIHIPVPTGHLAPFLQVWDRLI